MTASREATSTEPLSTRRELELLRDLQRLANEHAREEQRIAAALAEGLEAAEKARDAAAGEVEQQFTKGRTTATDEYERTTRAARERYETDRNAAQQEYKGLRQGVESELARIREAARSEQQTASWETLTVFDALKGQPREKFLATVQHLKRHNQELAVLEQDATDIMKMRRQWRAFPPVEPTSNSDIVSQNGEPEPRTAVATETTLPPAAQRGWKSLPKRPVSSANSGSKHGLDEVDQAIQRAADETAAVREETLALHNQKLPRLFEGGTPFGVFLGLWLIASVPCAIVIGWQNWVWVGVSLAAAIIASVGALAWLWPVARAKRAAVPNNSAATSRCSTEVMDGVRGGPRTW